MFSFFEIYIIFIIYLDIVYILYGFAICMLKYY